MAPPGLGHLRLVLGCGLVIVALNASCRVEAESPPTQTDATSAAPVAPPAAAALALADSPAPAAQPVTKADTTEPPNTTGEQTKPTGPVPLNRQGTVLLDAAGKRLLLKSVVTLREGALELLCCIAQTKEHEAILALDAKAYVVHTGLLALGAKAGTPVRFDPEYRTPTGDRIDIFLSWKDERGRMQRVPAQTWVRNATRRFWGEPLEKLPDGVTIPKTSELRYDSKLKELSWYGHMTPQVKTELLALSKDPAFQKAINNFFDVSQFREMNAAWVFAGSGFYVDPDTGKKFYLAEDGDLICVANFASATLDVAVESSAGNEGLLFEAYTERIPPKGTAVTIELIPVLAKPGDKPAEKPTERPDDTSAGKK